MQRFLASSAIVALIAFAGPIQAADKYGVKDDAKFFTQAAVDKANQQLEDLSKTRGVNFKIETLPEVEKAKLSKATDAEKGKHFKALATRRFNDLKLGKRDGFLVVSRQPGWVAPQYGDDLAKHISPKMDNQLTAALVARKPDEGLDGVLKSVGEAAVKLPATATASSAKSPTTSGFREGAAKAAQDVKKDSGKIVEAVKETGSGLSTPTVVILAVVAGLVLLFALKGMFGGKLRQQTSYPPPPQNYNPPQGGPGPGGQGMNQPLGYGRPQAPPPPQQYPQQGYPQQHYPQQPPQGGGGGGFMKGMLGGVIGGAAGAYMYDKMTGGGGAQAGSTGSGAAAGSTGGDYGSGGDFGEAPAAAGGDYGSGGDFGEAPAGGDYGGGGDFGEEATGGDYGGGGDFGEEATGGDYGGGGDFGGDGGGDYGGGGDFGDS